MRKTMSDTHPVASECATAAMDQAVNASAKLFRTPQLSIIRPANQYPTPVAIRKPVTMYEYSVEENPKTFSKVFSRTESVCRSRKAMVEMKNKSPVMTQRLRSRRTLIVLGVVLELWSEELNIPNPLNATR